MVVGITGQSGGGKTLVSGMLSATFDFNVINADIVARQVVEADMPALNELVDCFGNKILESSGELNRSKLGDIVFNDMDEKLKMEKIIFPHIIKEIKAQIRAIKKNNNKAIFLDAPTLFESGVNRVCNRTVSVIAPKSVRAKRLLKRDNATPEQIQSRLDSQHDDDFYIKRSDFVIQNTGNVQEMGSQILAMLKEFEINT